MGGVNPTSYPGTAASFGGTRNSTAPGTVSKEGSGEGKNLQLPPRMDSDVPGLRAHQHLQEGMTTVWSPSQSQAPRRVVGDLSENPLLPEKCSEFA